MSAVEATTPTISVLMSVYNGLPYLEEAIVSVLQQDFTDFEFVIIDDASTDTTWDVLLNWATKDSRIRLFKNEQNLGLTKTLNKGLALAQGQYIARQDADDVSLPGRFTKQVKLLKARSEVALVSCGLEFIDGAGNPLNQTLSHTSDSRLAQWYLLFYNYLAGHSQVMFRRDLVVQLGGYCEDRRYSQDYELWCRLNQQGQIVILPDVLLQQRMHGTSISASKRSEQEALSLAQSQHNLSALTGSKIALEDVADLRGLLMIPNYWYYFTNLNLPIDRANRLNEILRQIYQSFLQRLNSRKSIDAEFSHQLRSLISQQFICWMQHLSLRKNPVLKLQTLRFAFAWSPKTAFTAVARPFPVN